MYQISPVRLLSMRTRHWVRPRFPCLAALVHQRQQVWSFPLMRAGRAWRSYLFATWTSAGEVLILSVQSSWQVAHVAT